MSSSKFAEQMIRGLVNSGCDVLSIGEVSTPMLYYAVAAKDVDAGVMITGSHNPPDHNGFKICLRSASVYGEQIQEIRALADSHEFISGSGTISATNVFDDYCCDLLNRLSMSTVQLKVIIDAGNGMGGITAVPIYRAMGIEVVEMFTEPDGTFPNHHPDPTVPANLSALIEEVLSTNADLGIAFDGDGDRIGVVDNSGRIIWGDELMILFSRSILEKTPGATIIGEVKCSQTLYDDIEKHGGNPVMWKTGHSLIKAKIRESGALLAGEMSGHIFFADRFYGFDDATYAGARLIEILANTGKRLSELLSDIPETYSTPEIRIDCPEEKKFQIVERVTDRFSRTNDVITVDGARIKYEHGWALIRASNTQSILVLRFEADSPEQLNAIKRQVVAVLREYLPETLVD